MLGNLDAVDNSWPPLPFVYVLKGKPHPAHSVMRGRSRAFFLARTTSYSMSYALAPRAPHTNGDREARIGHVLSPPLSAEKPDLAPETLTVTPACERVYCYSVSESSTWTTADLLRILRVIVQTPVHSPSSEASSRAERPAIGTGQPDPYVNGAASGDGGLAFPTID